MHIAAAFSRGHMSFYHLFFFLCPFCGRELFMPAFVFYDVYTLCLPCLRIYCVFCRQHQGSVYGITFVL